MPKVNRVEHARKPQGKCSKCGTDIISGAPYVWWKFRYGGRRVRCTKPECQPKPSDLTQSEYLSTVYEWQERTFEFDCREDVESAKEEMAGEIETLRCELEEKLDNMPEGLRDGDTGQLLQERIASLQEAQDAIESIEVEIEGEEPEEPERAEGETDEAFAARRAAWCQEVEKWNEKNQPAFESAANEIVDALSSIS